MISQLKEENNQLKEHMVDLNIEILNLKDGIAAVPAESPAETIEPSPPTESPPPTTGAPIDVPGVPAIATTLKQNVLNEIKSRRFSGVAKFKSHSMTIEKSRANSDSSEDLSSDKGPRSWNRKVIFEMSGKFFFVKFIEIY